MWHHFDPPWSIKQHHNPEGMIALCPNHHKEADSDEFSKNQLRELKTNPNPRELIQKEYGWMFPHCLIRLGGGAFAPSWCVLTIADLVVFQAKRVGGKDDHLAFTFALKNEDDELIACMEDNLFVLYPDLVHDLSVTASGNRMKIWSDERKVGLEFHFSRKNLEDIERIIEQDRPNDKKYLELAGPAEPIDDLEDFYLQLSQIDEVRDLFPLIYQQNDPVGVFIRWHACKCLDEQGDVPFLDLIAARFWHAGKCVEMRNGKLMLGDMSLGFCAGNTFSLR